MTRRSSSSGGASVVAELVVVTGGVTFVVVVDGGALVVVWLLVVARYTQDKEVSTHDHTILLRGAVKLTGGACCRAQGTRCCYGIVTIRAE